MDDEEPGNGESEDDGDDQANGGTDSGNDDDGNGDNGGSDNGNGDDPPAETALELTVQDPVERLVEGETAAITVDVSGDEAEADWAGVRWATESTSGDESPEPDDFDGELEGDNLSFPGEYTVSDWGPSDVGAYFVRAHVQVGEQDFWSDEFEVEVVAEVEEGDFEADHTVDIETNLASMCAGDLFDPEELEIQVGETVNWFNDADCTHTATSGGEYGDPDGIFDTGAIESGDESDSSYRFNKAGTYEYYCSRHSGMEIAEIVVIE